MASRRFAIIMLEVPNDGTPDEVAIATAARTLSAAAVFSAIISSDPPLMIEEPVQELSPLPLTDDPVIIDFPPAAPSDSPTPPVIVVPDPHPGHNPQRGG